MHLSFWYVVKFVYLFSVFLYILAEARVLKFALRDVEDDLMEECPNMEKPSFLESVSTFPFKEFFKDFFGLLFLAFVPVINTFLAFSILISMESIINQMSDQIRATYILDILNNNPEEMKKFVDKLKQIEQIEEENNKEQIDEHFDEE